jgi:hypothetical protein
MPKNEKTTDELLFELIEGIKAVNEQLIAVNARISLFMKMKGYV